MELAIQRQEVGERVFRAIGEPAPAFGMVGTLVGLVQMLSSMDDPTTIGRAMAIALLTTLYGLLIAQLIALPISDMLEAKNAIEKANRVLIIEAIIQIHERNNSTAVLDILEAYLPEKQRNLREDDPSPGANMGHRQAGRVGANEQTSDGQEMNAQNKRKIEGAPRWMVTFADLMALLFALFVLLLSFAEVDSDSF